MDIWENAEIISLPIELYADVKEASDRLNMDFDDAYQYVIAKHHNLTIVTMDNDFKKADSIKVLYI